MLPKLKLPAFFLLTFFLCQPVLAQDLGTNITAYDRESSTSNTDSWYGPQEDQEVEPGNVAGQIWDLEGFFLQGSQLSIVSGFDLQNGEYDSRASDSYWNSGDIFIDVDGNAQYGDMLPEYGSTGVVSTSNAIYQYDYVVDVNWETGAYQIYAIDDSSVLTTYFGSNNRANPYLFDDGAVDTIGTGGTASFLGYDPDDPLTDAETGFLGGTHYAAIFDLSELFSELNTIDDWDGYMLAHFTMECGNDNLIGVVPEPTTVVISGLFLLGAGLFVRRKLHGAV